MIGQLLCAIIGTHVQDNIELISLIYVSRSTIPRSRHEDDIDAIMSGSIARNHELAVRGVLIFTEGHFAQLLEGPKAGVDELMASIERDQRHEQLTVIERRRIDDYRFPDWGLAYWGSAAYVNDKLSSLLDARRAVILTQETRQIFELMWQLTLASKQEGKPIGLRSRG